MGTDDPTAFLSVPVAIEFLGALVPGGWPEIRERNRSLVLQARGLLASALGVEPPCPEAMIGSLASLPLPDGSSEAPSSALYVDPLQETLLREHRIEVPIVPWPAPPRRLLRVSAQLYNEIGQYERLVVALKATGTIRG
jgi:isopenicillin-N epimerase